MAGTRDTPGQPAKAVPAAALFLTWRVVEPGNVERFSAVIASLHLEAGRQQTPALAKNRAIDIDLRKRSEETFTLPAPPGKYERMVAVLEKVARHDRIELKFELPIDARSGMVTRIDVTVSAKALAGGSAPQKTFQASAMLMGESVQAAIDARRTQTIFLDPSDPDTLRRVGGGLTVPPGALPDGTLVDIHRRDPDALPPLFPRQVRVGPVIEINAAAAAREQLEVTVPYDAAMVATIGKSPAQLVVMRLDNARRTYEELRPYRIDTADQTLTARTTGLSSFFACTGGITVEIPPPFHNVAGDTVFYVTTDTTSVAGTVEAMDAVVTLQGLNVASGFTRAGRFAFEGVELLPRIESRVTLRAEVNGVLTHTCQITLRRLAPPKRIGAAHRFAGPTLHFLDIGTPVVSSGIVQVGRTSNDSVLPRLGSWQRSLKRYAAVIEEYDATDESWHSIQVIPERFFENEAARFAVDILNIFFDPLVVDETIPAGTRWLQAIETFLQRRNEPEATGQIRDFLDVAFQQVGPGIHALTSTLPWVQMNDGFYGVAYAAATYEGVNAARTNALRPYLDRLYGQQFDPLDPQITAGRLFFRRVSRQRSEEPELVTENLVWCTSLAMQLHPLTGEPVILALTIRPAEVVGDDAPLTGASLLICSRRANGTWTEQQVPLSHPCVSADFAFAPDGSIRIVAALLDRSGFQDALNCRMVLLAREGELWIEEPITWLEGRFNVQRDRGIWPRIVFDSQGRLVIALCFDVKAIAAPLDPDVPFRPPAHPFPIDWGVHWFVGLYDGVGWRMNRVAAAENIDLTGAYEANFDLALGTTAQSATGFAQWAPSIAADSRGTLWMAYGKGTLHLMEIDLDSLEGTDRAVDVDRTTGFYPSLALRDSGVPAVAYKDLFGTGERRRPRNIRDFTGDHFDDLHFFRFDEGNFVPRGNPPEPLAPGFAVDFANLQGFGERLPLSCATIAEVGFGSLFGNAAQARLLASLLMHATFDWAILPGQGPGGLVRDLRIKLSHQLLARHLETIFPRPDIIEVFIRNDRADEDIRRIDLTMFGDLFTIDDPNRKLLEELRLRSMGQLPVDPPPEDDEDDGRDDPEPPAGGGRPPRPPRPRRPMPIRLRNYFARSHWPLSLDKNITVAAPDPEARPPRNFWLLTDSAAFTSSSRMVAQIYQIHVDGNRLIVRLPPCLTVTDQRDRTFEVCRHPQEFWDLIASGLSGSLGTIIPPLPDEVKIGRLIAAAGIRFRRQSHDPSFPQQGSVRFIADIPHFVAWTDDPVRVVLRTLTPSEAAFSLAPFVRNAALQWYPRSPSLRLGEIETTIDASKALPWWSVFFAVTGPLFAAGVLIGTEIVEGLFDDLATEEANAQADKAIGLAGLIQPVYSTFALTRFPGGQPPALDAVLMRDQILTYWTREDGPDRRTLFHAVPDRLILTAAVGAPATGRNLLIENAGYVPLSVDDVSLATADGEFRIASTPSWPNVLSPGEADIIRIEFAPDLPLGTHTNTLRVRFNGSQTLEVPLSGIAQSPRSLLVRPDRLNFSAVTAGASRALRVELVNEGQGALTVTALRIQADAANQGRFTVGQAVPLTVAGQSSSFVDVTFRPQAMLATGNRAMLVIESDDLVHPRVEVALLGFGAAGNLMVLPTSLTFTNTPVGGAIPENRQALSLQNTGLAPVTVIGNSLRIVDPVGNVSPHFQLLDNSAQPVRQQDTTIPSSGQLLLMVRFRPTAAGDHHASLQLRSSTVGQADIAVLIHGRGV